MEKIMTLNKLVVIGNNKLKIKDYMDMMGGVLLGDDYDAVGNVKDTINYFSSYDTPCLKMKELSKEFPDLIFYLASRDIDLGFENYLKFTNGKVIGEEKIDELFIIGIQS